MKRARELAPDSSAIHVDDGLSVVKPNAQAVPASGNTRSEKHSTQRRRRRRRTRAFADLEGEERLERGKKIYNLALAKTPDESAMTARERFSVFELFLSAISKAHPRSTLSELGSETCISHGETLSHIIDERHAPLAVRLLRSVMCAINRSSEKAMGACAVCGYEKASLLYHRDADSQTCIECFWNHIGPEIQKGGVCGGPFAWLKQWSLFRKRVFEASLHSTCPGCATYDDSGALLCVKETGKCALDIHHIEGDNAVQPRSAVDTQALIDLAGSISGLSSHIVQPAGQADASYDTSAEDHAPLPQEHQQLDGSKQAATMWDVCSEYHLCLDWMEYYAKRASELLDKHPNFRLHVHRSSSSLTGNMPSNVHDLCGCAGHEKSNSCMFFHDPLRTVKIVKHVTTLKTMLDQDKRFFEQVADFAWQAKRTVNERVLHDRDAFESVDAPIDRNMLDPGASPEENFLLASQRQNRMTNEKYAGNRFSNSMEKTLAPRNRTRNFTQFEDARTWCTAWFGVPSNYVLAVLADPVARPSELFDMVSWANLAEMRKIAKAWQRTGFSTHDLETYINEAAAKRNYIDDSSQQNFCKCMDLFKDRIEASSNQAHVELLHSHRKLFFDAFVKYVYYTKLQLGGPGPDRIRCPILEARVSLDTFSDHATQHRTAILDDLPAMAYEGNGPDTAPLPSPPNATDFIDNAPEHLLQTEGGFEFDSSNLDAGRDGNYAGAPENFYSTDGSEQLFATPDQLFHDDIQDIPVTLRPWDPIGGELSDDVWSQPRTVH